MDKNAAASSVFAKSIKEYNQTSTPDGTEVPASVSQVFSNTLKQVTTPVDLNEPEQDDELFSMWTDEEEGEKSAFEKSMLTTVDDWGKAMKLGYQDSITGMISRKALADPELQDKFRHMTYAQIFFHGMGQTFDLPYYLGGFALGGGFVNPITGGGGAMALPAGIRQVYVDRLTKGKVRDGKDFAIQSANALLPTGKDLLSALDTSGKAWLAGAMGKGIGSMSPKLVAMGGQVPAEIATMTAVGAALDGRMPTMGDFNHAAIGMLSMHIGSKIAATPKKVLGRIAEKTLIERNTLDLENIQGRLMEHYTKTGELPGRALLRAQKDQLFRQELLSQREQMLAHTDQHFRTEFEKVMHLYKQPITTKQLASKPVAKTIREGIADVKTAPKKSPSEWLTEKKNEAISKLVNDNHVLVKWTEKMTGGSKHARMLAAIDNPAKVAQLARGLAGKVTHFHEHGGFDVNTLKINSRSMKDILGDAKKIMSGKEGRTRFHDYIVAKHATALEAKGIKTGFENVDKSSTKKLDAVYEPLMKDLVQLQNSALKQLRDTNIVSEKAYQTMLKDQTHVPFKRAFEAKGSPFEMSAGMSVRTPLKAQTGGKQKIYDIFESIELDIMGKLQAVENQRLAQSIVNLAQTFDIGGQGIQKAIKKQKISPEELQKIFESKDGGKFFSETDGNIAIFQKGKRVEYKIDKEVADLVKTLGTSHTGTFTKIARPFAGSLRAGATLLADFALKNLIRDSVMSYVTTKNTRWMPHLGMEILYEVFRGSKKTEAYKEFLRAGGANSTLVSIDRPSIRKQIRKDIRDSKFHNVIEGINPLKHMRAFSEHMEMATRMAEYKQTKKRLAKQGITGRRQLQEAAFEGREITLDFARSGSKTKQWNQVSAFFNATVQGHSKIFRALKDSPMSRLRVMASIVLPSMMVAMMNKGDEDIKQISKVQRDLFWVFKLPTGQIMRVPKPHELGIAGSIVERGMEFMMDGDPHAFDDLGKSLGGLLMPNVVPTLLLPISEAAFNWSFFRDRPLVSASVEGRLPEYRYGNYTSEIAKAAANALAYIPGLDGTFTGRVRTPIALENFVNAWTGGIGKHTLYLVNKAATATGLIKAPVKPTVHWTEQPLIKSFFLRHPSMSAESVNLFYKNYAKNNQIARTVSGLTREMNLGDIPDLMLRGDFGTLTKVKSVMDDLSANRNIILRATVKSSGMEREELADWKRFMIEEITLKQIAFAKQANEMNNLVRERLDKMQNTGDLL